MFIGKDNRGVYALVLIFSEPGRLCQQVCGWPGGGKKKSIISLTISDICRALLHLAQNGFMHDSFWSSAGTPCHVTLAGTTGEKQPRRLITEQDGITLL